MSSKDELSKAIQNAENTYYQRTTASRKLNEFATSFLPGGDTRAAVYFHPYPTYIVHGNGCYVYDADGNKYFDLLNNFTQVILGHNHPKIREAIIKQLECGTIFGAPSETQIKLGKLLCERIPSIEKIRFCNSGTESTMFAIKGARAYTGKNKIIKIEGMYHGTHDLVEASVLPPLTSVGDPLIPNVVPYNPGIPANILENLVVVPFNNIKALNMAIERNKGDIAAVIIEPIMTGAGMIPAEPDYLRYVRNITTDEGIILIFDEVVTFRLSHGGAQELYGIIPDITTIGKFIGGGFPVGAFGGNEDIMSIFSPPENVFTSNKNQLNKAVKHSGTFNGHPVIMSAGLATMQELTPEVINRINELGEELKNRLNDEIFKALGIRAQAKGWGSLIYIHYTHEELNNYRDVRKSMDEAGKLFKLVHLEALNNGIWIAERGEIAISTPTTANNISETIQVYKDVFLKIKPVLEKDFPHLIQ